MNANKDVLDKLINVTLQTITHMPREGIRAIKEKLIPRLSQPLREELFDCLFDNMWLADNSALSTTRVFVAYEKVLRDFAFNFEGANVLEIGAGKPLGTGMFWLGLGAASYTSVDRYVEVNTDKLWQERFNKLLAIRGENVDAELELGKRLFLKQEDFMQSNLPKENYDLIYSNAVLEHVADPKKIIAKMASLLKPGGIMLHGIDLRAHHTRSWSVLDKEKYSEFLSYSKEEWEEMFPVGCDDYINRCRAYEFTKWFKNEGFKVMQERTALYFTFDPSEVDLAPEFKNLEWEELSKASIFYVLKKQKNYKSDKNL